MNDLLTPYIGDLEKFIEFLEKKWGWKIDYNKKTKTLIANENKNYCVCPMINKKNKVNQSAICYCSEGFAERMFSLVASQPVSAAVISSIQRGDERCIYKIDFNS
jgi:predicted hydrocarbon binding protein